MSAESKGFMIWTGSSRYILPILPEKGSAPFNYLAFNSLGYGREKGRDSMGPCVK